ncbi:FAD-dependent oxidoreductase [Bacillus mangrovi]|uniref:FAD-dependent oxidoreductase n=1 Tax=Metabacillus mangrovi TaxID=1491830 RepID=A0A7X2S139_9BACI|nr:FAD-dependent oxidoreductase [Metabacillus mangrovi]MTH51933.1 FAD-dependent oxidoreductase [Metabacillus mangrovi]
MTRIAIIGAGILGASAAYHLAKSGADVMIADSAEPGQATGAAAGIICPWLSQRRNQAWYQLAKNGAGYYPDLIKALELDGETNTGYFRSGAVSLNSDEKKIRKTLERAEKRQPDAPEMGAISFLSPEQTSALFPLLKQTYYGVHVSGGARADGRKLRDALLNGARKHGATYITGAASLLFEGNKVTGMEVNGEHIPADCTAVCAGAWGAKLLDPLQASVKVTFQKAQIVHLRTAEKETSEWPVLMPPGTHYLLAFPGGRVAAGTTHEDTEEYSVFPTAGGISEILQKAAETAPELASAEYVETRVGFRPFTEDFLPVIGGISGWDGLLFANGLGSSGLTTGPYIGKQLASLALGEDPDLDLSPYQPQTHYV